MVGYRRFGTGYRSRLQGRLETTVATNKPMLRNIAEERGPQLRYGRSVAFHILGFEKMTQEYGLF